MSIILGYNEYSSLASVLLMRFHKFDRRLTKKETPRKLLTKVTACLDNNGLEQRRSGGSSGEFSYSKELMRLMKTPNCTPRCSRGFFYLRDKNNLQLHVFYLSTKTSDLKVFKYTTPQRGGVFAKPSSLIKKQLAIRNFIMAKPLAALILSKITRFSICPEAVEIELSCIQGALTHVNALSALNLRRSDEFYQHYSDMYVHFTLIRHPVGRHLDVFSKGKPSLENRICFSCPLLPEERSRLRL